MKRLVQKPEFFADSCSISLKQIIKKTIKNFDAKFQALQFLPLTYYGQPNIAKKIKKYLFIVEQYNSLFKSLQDLYYN